VKQKLDAVAIALARVTGEQPTLVELVGSASVTAPLYTPCVVAYSAGCRTENNNIRIEMKSWSQFGDHEIMRNQLSISHIYEAAAEVVDTYGVVNGTLLHMLSKSVQEYVVMTLGWMPHWPMSSDIH